MAELGLVVALVSAVLVVNADLALHKPFWLDEGHEIVRTCDQSTTTLLLKGAYECSPAPLYWIAQGAVVRSVQPLGLSLRLKYRAVSLAAASLTLLALLLGLRGRLGLPAALVAFSVLVTDPGFHFYAAQNRAYMTWTALTALLTVVAAEAAVLDGPRFRAGLAALMATGALAGLTALPGCLQAAGAFAACASVRLYYTSDRRLDRRQALALALGALVIFAVDAHYWAGSPCRGARGAYDTGLDLFSAADRGHMVRRAFSVLWPEGWSPLTFLGHAAMLVGAAVPLLLWRRRAELGLAERYAAALSLVSLAQVLVMVPVAVGLAAGHYLFLPRMFIFAMVARASWIALGFWWLARVAQNAGGGLRRWGHALPAMVVGLVVVGALWQGDRFARSLRLPLGPVGPVACDELRVPTLRLMEPAGRSPEFTPNFLVRLGRALESCAATPVRPQPPRHLLALEAERQANWLRVVDRPAEGFKALGVCGRAVVVESGRARVE